MIPSLANDVRRSFGRVVDRFCGYQQGSESSNGEKLAPRVLNVTNNEGDGQTSITRNS